MLGAAGISQSYLAICRHIGNGLGQSHQGGLEEQVACGFQRIRGGQVLHALPASQCSGTVGHAATQESAGDVSKELKRLESASILEKSDSSPWISNLVVARKKIRGDSALWTSEKSTRH